MVGNRQGDGSCLEPGRWGCARAAKGEGGKVLPP